MPNQLVTNIGLIKSEKNTKIIPGNIKSGVTIFDVTGSYDSSDYSSLGYGIDIEAQNTINKGDKIIAQTNSSGTVPIYNGTLSYNGIVAVSKDQTVALQAVSGQLAQEITEGSQMVVLFLDEQTGQYGDGYTLTFTNFPTSNFSLYNSFILNEDGTLAYSSNFKSISNAVAFENVCIVIEIDKENKTAQYFYKTFSFPNCIAGGSSSATYTVTIDSPELNGSMVNNTGAANGTVGHAIENYVICASYAHVLNAATGTYSSVKKVLTIYIYDTETHTFVLDYYFQPLASPVSLDNGGQWGTATSIDNDNFLFVVSSSSTTHYYCKYTKSTKAFSISASVSSNSINGVIRFSNGGHYTCHIVNSSSNATITVYSISHLDLSLTQSTQKVIPNSSRQSTVGYVSDDGRYVYCSAGVLYDLLNETSYLNDMITTSTGYIINTFLTVNRFVLYRGSSRPYKAQIRALTPGSDAEYIASATQSTDCSSAGIYGIASESLVVGQRGEARALFQTNGP